MSDQAPLPRVAVLTLAAGRHRHLSAQLAGLARSELEPTVHIVAAMGDPHIDQVVEQAAPAWPTVVVPVPVPPSGELPLARARNTAAAHALAREVDLLVFLDVDCIPAPVLLSRYRAAADQLSDEPVTALCGPVHYLPPLDAGQESYPPGDLGRLAQPHPARPVPADHELLPATDLRLFWSLSFAIRAADWERTGGFCEQYVGYGGEDTDFAMMVAGLGGRMLWVGGAAAYHQHHPVESPPTRHLDAIVRNANVFYRRWGWFAMEGWLAAFNEMGIAHFDADSSSWVTGPVSSRYSST